LAHNGSSRGEPQARCRACGSTVTLRYGTAYYGLLRFLGTMPHLTSCPSSRCPRCYPCSSVLPLPEERSGSPTFTGSLLRHAVLSDPGEAAGPLPFPRTAVGSSDRLTSSTLPQVSLTGLHHFSLAAYGLPHPCLRLTDAVTGHRLKTRYEMGWVGPFSVALSATSEPAPRGALTLCNYRIIQPAAA
jgi:hypothetical protein